LIGPARLSTKQLVWNVGAAATLVSPVALLVLLLKLASGKPSTENPAPAVLSVREIAEERVRSGAVGRDSADRSGCRRRVCISRQDRTGRYGWAGTTASVQGFAPGLGKLSASK
jgi:hypothetical protein